MGKKFAEYDQQGNIIAQYDSVDSPVPDGVENVVELTADQYATWANAPARWYAPNGVFTESPVPSDEYVLNLVKAGRVAELADACRAAICAGFSSNALGAAHTYPANDVDQQNLSASVLDSLIPGIPSDWTTPYWCADATGEWAFRAHTAAQIQQVGRDSKVAILAAMTKNVTLAAQVKAAKTVAEVQAIAWSSQ